MDVHRAAYRFGSITSGAAWGGRGRWGGGAGGPQTTTALDIEFTSAACRTLHSACYVPGRCVPVFPVHKTGREGAVCLSYGAGQMSGNLPHRLCHCLEALHPCPAT